LGRPLRLAPGGIVYHVLNRANARVPIFDGPRDYLAFIRSLSEAVEREATRLLAYCIMPNHWHLVIWPREDGELSRFTGWLTLTHTQRWHAHRHTTGLGHLYQGRFRSFPVQQDHHFLTLCRYVERNPLRAGLVGRAEDWQWSSLWRRFDNPSADDRPMLAEWPVPRPSNWEEIVNRPQSPQEEATIRTSQLRGHPYGDLRWQAGAAASLGLTLTLRPRGRPRSNTEAEKGS
jgi:putative transposase